MKRTRYTKTVACAVALGLMLGALPLFPARAAAQKEDTSGGVELRPGLLIHPTLDVAYVMTPQGVAAIDIATGTKKWDSTAAAKPLTLAKNLLISQADSRNDGNLLVLVGLDVEGRGSPSLRGTTDLPGSVKISVGETPDGKFDLTARPSANAVLLTWAFDPATARGRDEERRVVKVETNPAEGEPQPFRNSRLLKQLETQTSTAGGLLMSLTTGQVTHQATPQDSFLRLQVDEPPPRRILSAGEKVAAAAAATQYVSADGRHVLASERIGDDRIWEKYRWTVYERRTGRRLGELQTHLAFSPFVVRGALVIFETTPFTRRGERPEPAKLRAYSLITGREAWSVTVREIVYRGPFPP
ncbi:MAG TPA: hypothetical protein VGB98_09150 [Pyrinomonadaceae bacterium]|jgi:outer membrane protein assembly factor BamB